MNQIPCSEYPRPQMKRSSYFCLNGEWDYHIESTHRSESGKLIVPFSMESKINGCHEMLKPDETLIMEKTFELPKGFNQGQLLLHLDAVDQQSVIYINDRKAAESQCGYLPITVNMTDFLQPVNHLRVVIRDPSNQGSGLRGKQSLHPKGIWYTAQSGIWQSVWIESVPEQYIEALKITPLFDEQSVEIFVDSNDNDEVKITCDNQSIMGISNQPIIIHLKQMHPWSPDDPYLYQVEIDMGLDHIESYFGMRKFSVEEDAQGIKRLFLNNVPCFHSGLLDQGYNSEGLLSWPDDEMMVQDIKRAKSMGFNMLRKHIKIEPLRWYYHCDRLGMLVWQDMVNGGAAYNLWTISSPLITGISFKDSYYSLFARKDETERERFMAQLKGMIHHLYNCVSIAMWVPFNEGWGQFDSEKAVELIQKLDATRTIDAASGWHDQKKGEFKSLHVYFKPYKFKPDKMKRCVILSEFGGYQLPLKGHTQSAKSFGYKKISNQNELEKALTQLYENEILPAAKKGLSACVYTQLSDVESEVNGLITYDRRKVKVNTDMMKQINEQLKRLSNESK